WTPAAFIQNQDRGLGVDVKSDQGTAAALEQMLTYLVDRPIEWLRNKAPIDASVLYSLAEDDPVRTLLQWIDDPISIDTSSEAEQAAFRSRCSGTYGLSVDGDGPIVAARKLADANGEWRAVWRRYREAPRMYPGVEERLRQAAAASQTTLSLGLDGDDPVHAWPQHNESEEKSLRESLSAADGMTREGLVDQLDVLEARHGLRRNWVWRQLGRSPLAQALQHLVALASSTPVVQSAPVTELANWYAKEGWSAEDAVMRAFDAVSAQADRNAVQAVVDALYGGWCDHSARVFQDAVAGGDYLTSSQSELPPSTCLVFTDGLRLDLGHRLADLIRSRGLTVTVETQLAALPTITATAKPALSPVADSLQSGPGLEPTTNGSTKVNAAVLRGAMNEAGIQTLQAGEVGDTSGRAWTEIGSIDSDGHHHQIGLAARVEDDLVEIAQRVSELVDAGWRNVEIVTDHGFLLMPTPMKKAALPAHLVELRKGRCARLGDGDEVEYETVAWRWDLDVRWAIAPGTACFEAGKQYEHGGVSLPECVVPHLRITKDLTVQPVTLSKPKWRGM
ncbi:MAG: BREX-1 system phosphatase PglZ type B, partial [Acidimicrobiales bacterium]